MKILLLSCSVWQNLSKQSLDEFLKVLYNENIHDWEEMSITVTDPVHQARR
jgi:hypothetical protein